MGAFFILISPVESVSQRHLGVDWHVPQNSREAVAELKSFHQAGIRLIQIQHDLSPQLWQELNAVHINVFAKLPLNFPVQSSIVQLHSNRQKKLSRLLSKFENRSAVKAVGIFAYGNIKDANFRAAITRFLERLHPPDAKPLYYISAESKPAALDSLFDFKIVRLNHQVCFNQSAIGGYVFDPAGTSDQTMFDLKSILKKTSANPEKPFFLPSPWLIEMLKKYPSLGETLKLYKQKKQPAFALPVHKSSTQYSSAVIAGMLLLLWVLFAFTYNFSPIYRKSFLRYITGHRFFVEDIMQRHIRSSVDGISILLQHTISGGVVSYCLLKTLFTPLGWKAVVTHYAGAAFLGNGDFTFFLWGFIIVFLLETASLLWLWVANPWAVSLKQIINLYPWMLQLNLITATVVATVYLSYRGEMSLYMLAAVFLTVALCSFIITAIDISRYVPTRAAQYVGTTLIIYLALICGLGWWISNSPVLRSVIALATSLP